MSASALHEQHCVPLKGRENALSDEALRQHLDTLPGWQRDGEGIRKRFEFDDYHRTMAFVNAVAWIAHREDHHPDLAVSYSHCSIFYSSHDVGGLSLNDVICAAKVEALLD